MWIYATGYSHRWRTSAVEVAYCIRLISVEHPIRRTRQRRHTSVTGATVSEPGGIGIGAGVGGVGAAGAGVGGVSVVGPGVAGVGVAGAGVVGGGATGAVVVKYRHSTVRCSGQAGSNDDKGEVFSSVPRETIASGMRRPLLVPQQSQEQEHGRESRACSHGDLFVVDLELHSDSDQPRILHLGTTSNSKAIVTWSSWSRRGRC